MKVRRTSDSWTSQFSHWLGRLSLQVVPGLGSRAISSGVKGFSRLPDGWRWLKLLAKTREIHPKHEQHRQRKWKKDNTGYHYQVPIVRCLDRMCQPSCRMPSNLLFVVFHMKKCAFTSKRANISPKWDEHAAWKPVNLTSHEAGIWYIYIYIYIVE